MTLDNAKKGHRYKILKLNSTVELKKRFNAFGIARNNEVTIKEFAIAKKTIEVEVERSLVGIRLEEAKTIEVEEL